VACWGNWSRTCWTACWTCCEVTSCCLAKSCNWLTASLTTCWTCWGSCFCGCWTCCWACWTCLITCWTCWGVTFCGNFSTTSWTCSATSLGNWSTASWTTCWTCCEVTSCCLAKSCNWSTASWTACLTGWGTCFFSCFWANFCITSSSCPIKYSAIDFAIWFTSWFDLSFNDLSLYILNVNFVYSSFCSFSTSILFFSISDNILFLKIILNNFF